MKIALCIPHGTHVHAKFMASVVAMVQHTLKAEIVFNGVRTVPDIELMMETGSIVAAQRNFLAERAINWGANFILWLDSDHTFPPQALVRLLSLNKPVVGANYPRRGYPTYPTALDMDLKDLWTTRELAEAGAVEQVKRLGLGLCLVDITVIAKLGEYALAAGFNSVWPLFAFTPIEGDLAGGGEDAYFFGLLDQFGIEAYVDHRLSWQVGHLHEVALTNADALAQRDAYLASRENEAAAEVGQRPD